VNLAPNQMPRQVVLIAILGWLVIFLVTYQVYFFLRHRRRFSVRDLLMATTIVAIAFWIRTMFRGLD
jgi:hypothetical protein